MKTEVTDDLHKTALASALDAQAEAQGNVDGAKKTLDFWQKKLDAANARVQGFVGVVAPTLNLDPKKVKAVRASDGAVHLTDEAKV